MKKWNELSMREKAEYIKLGVDNGVTSLKDISDTYNLYAEGGPTDVVDAKLAHTTLYPTYSSIMSMPIEEVIIPSNGIPYRAPDYPVNKAFKDITEEIVNGDQYYYGRDDNIDWKNYYMDPNTNRVYSSIKEYSEGYDTSSLQKISAKDIKKLLPKRGYIGGTRSQTHDKYFEMVPEMTDMIKSAADLYEIDPNTLMHRVRKEGFIDNSIKLYNDASSKDQKTILHDLLQEEVNGFNTFGLDNAGTLLQEGKIKLLGDETYFDTDEINEKGRHVLSVNTPNVQDALGIKAGVLLYLKENLKKRGIKDEDLPMYMNAAYNLGLYSKHLNDRTYIEKNYKVPKYYD